MPALQFIISNRHSFTETRELRVGLELWQRMAKLVGDDTIGIFDEVIQGLFKAIFDLNGVEGRL